MAKWRQEWTHPEKNLNVPGKKTVTEAGRNLIYLKADPRGQSYGGLSLKVTIESVIVRWTRNKLSYTCVWEHPEG